MKIKKVKIKGQGVMLMWDERTKGGSVIESSITSNELARPELYEAMKALAVDVIDMCELPESYLEKITVRSVSFSYGGDPEVLGATISAGMKLENSYQDLNLNTPHKACEMYNKEAPEDEKQLLDSESIERLEVLMEECERFIKGERAQGTLFNVA